VIQVLLVAVGMLLNLFAAVIGIEQQLFAVQIQVVQQR